MKEIEIIIGDNLPTSAYNHNAWWSNEVKSHLHARSWVDEGYKTIKVKPGEEVTFIKVK